MWLRHILYACVYIAYALLAQSLCIDNNRFLLDLIID